MTTASNERDLITYGVRADASEFPLQIVLSMIYPCNLGCPFCPYTDGNSEIRKFFHEQNADLFPPKLFKKLADEAAPYKCFLRLTGGGEPTLHPQCVELIEYAKAKGTGIWLNTNGTLLGPHSKKTKRDLERLIECGIDMIEFSVDAGDPETYSIVRPPRRGKGTPERWHRLVAGIRYAVEYRNKLKAPTRLVCSIVMSEYVRGKIDQAVNFWLNDVQLDEVIKRKYLTWDTNTKLDFNHAFDPGLYAEINEPGNRPPCVWPFERFNVDSLGRVALCGQDISLRTSSQFPNLNEVSIKDVWHGEAFKRYREMHMAGHGDKIAPCNECSAWKAGVRDWNYGWLRVLNNAEKHRQQSIHVMDAAEVGAETDVIRRTQP